MKLLVVPCSERSVAVPSDTAAAAAAAAAAPAVPNCLDDAIVWQKFPKCSGINLSVT